MLCPESDCVYYISGSFFDGKEFVTESDNVLAVTVMPLTVRYVPYTFKLIGGRAEGGKALSCECDGKVYVKIPMQSLLLFRTDEIRYRLTAEANFSRLCDAVHLTKL